MLYQSANLRLETHYRIATLWLGVPGPEVNPLTRAVLAELDAALAAAAAHPGLDVLIFRSTRADGFSTGTDPDEWAGLTTPDEASELARLGQEVCRRLAALAPVTVAFLDGPCLGGGNPAGRGVRSNRRDGGRPGLGARRRRPAAAGVPPRGGGRPVAGGVRAGARGAGSEGAHRGRRGLRHRRRGRGPVGGAARL